MTGAFTSCADHDWTSPYDNRESDETALRKWAQAAVDEVIEDAMVLATRRAISDIPKSLAWALPLTASKALKDRGRRLEFD